MEHEFKIYYRYIQIMIILSQSGKGDTEVYKRFVVKKPHHCMQQPLSNWISPVLNNKFIF